MLPPASIVIAPSLARVGDPTSRTLPPDAVIAMPAAPDTVGVVGQSNWAQSSSWNSTVPGVSIEKNPPTASPPVPNACKRTSPAAAIEKLPSITIGPSLLSMSTASCPRGTSPLASMLSEPNRSPPLLSSTRSKIETSPPTLGKAWSEKLIVPVTSIVVSPSDNPPTDPLALVSADTSTIPPIPSPPMPNAPNAPLLPGGVTGGGGGEPVGTMPLPPAPPKPPKRPSPSANTCNWPAEIVPPSARIVIVPPLP